MDGAAHKIATTSEVVPFFRHDATAAALISECEERLRALLRTLRRSRWELHLVPVLARTARVSAGRRQWRRQPRARRRRTSPARDGTDPAPEPPAQLGCATGDNNNGAALHGAAP